MDILACVLSSKNRFAVQILSSPLRCGDNPHQSRVSADRFPDRVKKRRHQPVVPSRVIAFNHDAQQRLERALRAAYEGNEPDGPRSFAAVAWACRGIVPDMP